MLLPSRALFSMLLLGLLSATRLDDPARAQEIQPDLATMRIKAMERAEQSYQLRPPAEQELHRSIDTAPGTKIWNGEPVGTGIFNETVAIARRLSGNRPWLCSGVLLSKAAVLTAAHCVCDLDLLNLTPNSNLSDGAIWVGRTADPSTPTFTIRISRAILYDPAFCEKRNAVGIANAGIDLALLLLEQDSISEAGAKIVAVGPPRFPDNYQIAPARLAPPGLTLSSSLRGLTIVGFGVDEKRTVGLKQYANVPIVSRLCGSQLSRLYFGCQPGTQLVLAGFGKDTCSGDSGGPAYAILGRAYYLVAITSRAIDPSGACGPGGVYTLITPRVVNWIRAWGINAYTFQ